VKQWASGAGQGKGARGYAGEYDCNVYPYQIAFNCLPHIDVFTDNGYTKEEMKMVNETRKILEDDSIMVSATTVRIPVFYSHSESVNLRFEKFLSDPLIVI